MKRIVLLLLIICALTANDVNAHPQRGGRKYYGRTSSKVQKKLHQQSRHWRLEQVEKAKERAERNRWLAEWERQRAEQEKVRHARLNGIKEMERTIRNVPKLDNDTTHVNYLKNIRRRIEMINSSEVNHTSERCFTQRDGLSLQSIRNEELLNLLRHPKLQGQSLVTSTIPSSNLICITSGNAENQQ